MGAKRLDRRTFLGTTGVAIAAGGVACLWAHRTLPPLDDYPAEVLPPPDLSAEDPEALRAVLAAAAAAVLDGAGPWGRTAATEWLRGELAFLRQVDGRRHQECLEAAWWLRHSLGGRDAAALGEMSAGKLAGRVARLGSGTLVERFRLRLDLATDGVRRALTVRNAVSFALACFTLSPLFREAFSLPLLPPVPEPPDESDEENGRGKT